MKGNMTREFNQQRRYDPRPSFRNTPSNFHGDERPSGSTRPRLNREIVDRAWENGAAQRHPDYQPRQNGKPYGQAPRNAWQKKPYGAPSSPNGSAGNRPGSYTSYSGNRQNSNTNQYRQTNGYQKHAQQRPFNDDHGPRRQSFDRQQGSARYPANEPREYRSNNAPWHSSNPSAGRYAPGNQQPQRSRYQDSPQDRGANFRPAQSQPYTNRGRNDGQRFQGGQRPESFERGYNRYTDRGGPQQGNFRQRDNGYQTRPQHSGSGGFTRQNRWNGPDGRDVAQRRPYAEQFEGDYERFGYETNGYPERRRKETPAAHTRYEQPSQQAPQRHTTPLPDGRVLKGPRPVQRRQATFWNNVSAETSSLLDKPQTTAEQKEPQAQNQKPVTAERQSTRPVKPQPAAQASQQAASQASPATPVKGKKPVRRIASAERRKKAATSRTYPPGPRPSQRGFKWPTP